MASATHPRPRRPVPAAPALKPLATSLLCLGLLPAVAQVLPTSASLVAGSAAVGAPTPLAGGGASLEIVQGSDRAILEWQSFSIGRNDRVSIVQPGASSVLLNRVTGAQASLIQGQLSTTRAGNPSGAGGSVYLINPNGITFSSGATVNVGGLVASTLDIAGADAATRNNAFMSRGIVDPATARAELSFSGSGTGAVVVEPGASIVATGTATDGAVALLGSTVRNAGSIRAADGASVNLAAARGAILVIDPNGDGLTTLRITAPSVIGALVDNSGIVQADGGLVALQAASSASETVVNQSGTLRARTVAGRAGRIVLGAGGGSDLNEIALSNGSVDASGGGAAGGGSVSVSGPLVRMAGGTIDASGTLGGAVTLQGRAVTIGPVAGIVADGVAGRGGTVMVSAATASGDVQVSGSIRARGTSEGGVVSTSGSTIGIARSASIDAGGLAANGRWRASSAGEVLITSVTSAAGEAAYDPNGYSSGGSLSRIADAAVGSTLGRSTDVVIENTGIVSGQNGGIHFDAGAAVRKTLGTSPAALTLTSTQDIEMALASSIASTSGRLDVNFAAGSGRSGNDRGRIDVGGAITTNGGSITMNAVQTASAGGDSAVRLRDRIDTRSDSGSGGGLTVVGRTAGPSSSPDMSQPGVWLDGAAVSTGSGSVSLDGSSTNGAGVRIDGSAPSGGIATTEGAITVVGRGTDMNGSSNGAVNASGVIVEGVGLSSSTGPIVVRGRVDDPQDRSSGSAGVSIGGGARIATTRAGDIEITGSAVNGSPGIVAFSGSRTTSISANGSILLRASNGGSTDAVRIDVPIDASSVINLRPGGLDAGGNASDRTSDAIVLGGPASGFAISAAELGRLSAPALVLGSSAHRGDISVVSDIATGSRLTLQNEAGGAIRLDGAVSAADVALLAAGTIEQSATSSLRAGTLLARSRSGSVLLESDANDVAAVAGSANARFAYVDANAVRIAPVAALGADGSGPASVAQADLSADRILVRTRTDDLFLDASISARSDVDLVAGARFQNASSRTIDAANRRIWADTWVGESRGGLQGSAPAPNFYGCAYAGPCGVVVPASGNRFIYRQQPQATVTVDDASRAVGAANPPFTFVIDGLILGDTASSISGGASTSAAPASAPGVYPIDGNFTSPTGYVVRVVPGRLTVGASPYPGELYRLPTAQIAADTTDFYTYTFDRNLGHPPICFAAGVVDGDRATGAPDILAREWVRVRSRPNLSNCVSTDRRNGCNDF